MRIVRFAVVLLLWPTLAVAQSATPPAEVVPPPPPPETQYQADQWVGLPSNQTPDRANCGTPFEPKPCPPLPRHPLAAYPTNRPD